MKMKHYYLLLLSLLLLSCSQNEVLYDSDHDKGYHAISIQVKSNLEKNTRTANHSGNSVSIEDLVLFTVDKESRVILDTAKMEKRTEDTYSCRIPSKIDLAVAEYYAIANVGANFTNLSGIENRSFDEFLDIPVQLTHADNNPNKPTLLRYALMNREAATYDSSTNTISSISLSHLPARIYLDCEKLGYSVEKIVINNVSNTTSLRTIVEARGSEKNHILKWEDTLPGIPGNGENYYYLVYPSNQKASIAITSNGQTAPVVDLGNIKPGRSYTLRINYPDDISFEEITTDGTITVAKGEHRDFEFKVSNTAYIRNVTLTSSDESVFKVKGGTDTDWNKFTIEGVSPGVATLTAKCLDVTINCQVSVMGSPSVTINGELFGEFAPGQSVTIQAPFVEFKKFVSWTTDFQPSRLATIKAINLQSPSLTFTMPESNVSFTIEYTDAPYKMTMHKPGRIVNNKNWDFEPALVKETETTYIRYYKENEMVYMEAPKMSPTEGTKWSGWTPSEDTNPNFGYRLNVSQGGGGYVPATYFKMFNSDVEVTPFYPPAPYWSTEYTTKGYLAANFIDRVNPDPNGPTIPGGSALVRAYSRQEKEIIMRALHTLENTLEGAPRRTIKISFAVIKMLSGVAGGATDPMIATYPGTNGYESPKNKWTKSDFNGIAEGMTAISSQFEAVWRDQKNIDPNDADDYNFYVGGCDGYVLLDNNFINGCYKGESESSKPLNKQDFETLVLHELAHIVCYHSSSSRANPINGITACDVFIADRDDPENIRVIKGNMPEENSRMIFYNELVKSYYGKGYLEFTPGDYSHLHPDPLGTAVGSFGSFGPCCRRFPDFELAMLKEMGWKIKPTAWQNPPAPLKR